MRRYKKINSLPLVWAIRRCPQNLFHNLVANKLTAIKRCRIKNGFSLIEIAVAFSILAIAFIYIVSSFPFSLSINKRAENSSIASYLAQEKIEELHSLDYDNIAVGEIEPKHRLSGDQSSYLYNFQRKTEVIYVNDNLIREAADQGVKKILVNVYYTNTVSKTEQIYNITTLISRL